MRLFSLSILLILVPIAAPSPAVAQQVLTAPTDPDPQEWVDQPSIALRKSIRTYVRVVAAAAVLFIAYLALAEIRRRRKLPDSDRTHTPT